MDSQPSLRFARSRAFGMLLEGFQISLGDERKNVPGGDFWVGRSFVALCSKGLDT